MRRLTTYLLILSSLSFGGGSWLPAQNSSVDQSLSAGRFLDGVSIHPTGDESEKKQANEIAQSLSVAPPPEIERELPALMTHLRIGGEESSRLYAALFVLMIAIRPDGAAQLSARSDELSALILDADPGIQRVALAVMDYIIARPGVNNRSYLTALQTGLQRKDTPQDAGAGMIRPLLFIGSSDSGSLKSVLSFLQRDDLTPSTRMELVHELPDVPGLPDEVNQYLVKLLDDPDPHVRATALVSYADSTTAYHTLGKERVQRIANDAQEIQGIRELAKDAIAGKTHLSPNYDLPPLVLDPNTGAMPQKPENQ